MVQYLSSVYSQCANHFEHLLTSLGDIQDSEGAHLVDLKTLSNAWSRFRVWAVNVGAVHSGREYEKSLDYRLRNAPAYKELLQKILLRVDELLVQGHQALTTEEHDSKVSLVMKVSQEERLAAEDVEDQLSLWSSSESDSEDDAVATRKTEKVFVSNAESLTVRAARQQLISAANFQAVEEAETSLHRILNSLNLAIASLFKVPIRTAAPLSRLNRLGRRDDPLMKAFEFFDRQFVTDLYPNISSPLARRISAAITRRRRLLQYRKQHNDKLRQDKFDSSKVHLDGAAPEAAKFQPQNLDTGITQRPETSLVTESVDPSSFKATTFKHVHMAPPAHLLEDDIFSGADTISTSGSSAAGHERLVLPPRPQNADGENLLDFECLFCFTAVHVRGSQRAWKKHIFADIEPYQCTFPDCHSPDQTYTDRKQWNRHEDQHRCTFHCGSSGHEFYADKIQFVQHFFESHNTRLDINTDLSLAIFQKPAKEILSRPCPFCQQQINGSTSHVARHLERLAFFALPRTHEDPADGKSSSEVQGSVEPSVGNSDDGSQDWPQFSERDRLDEEIPALTNDYKKLLEIIDQLRVFDFEVEFSLPRLVVCGEQSAGKSSVLEAISGIPFPRNGSMCTRFVTQVNMWPAEESGSETIAVILKPYGGIKSGTGFRETINQLDELETLVEKASMVMRVGSLHDARARNMEAVAEFSRDILIVNVRAHGQTPLALIDLPGMFQSQGTGSTAAIATGKRMVDEIVDDWIKDENSIILAVVDAIRDPQSHTIFAKAAEVDPEGFRTMGIITKPDAVEPFLERQRTWSEVALNRDSRFKLRRGWHILRNRTERELMENNRNRDSKEKEYFEDAENGWHDIVENSKRSPDTCGYGAKALKRRLATLLERQTRQMLPQIQQQIDNKIKSLNSEIKKIGIAGQSNETAQKEFADCCMEMSDLAKDGISGNYESRKFTLKTLDQSQWDKMAVCFIRANIRRKDEEFATELRKKAHKSVFAWDHFDAAPNPDKWVERIEKALRQTEGTELQSYIDPARISLFFRDYSEGWKAVAEAHVQAVHQECKAFLNWVVDEIMKDHPGVSTLSQAVKAHILPIMRAHLAEAEQELERLEQDRNRPVRTVNIMYREQAQANRHNQTWRIVKQAMDSHDRSALNETFWLKPNQLAASVGRETEVDIRTQRAAEFIEDLLIYYKIASERYIEEVLIRVNERHMLDDIHKVFAELCRMDTETMDRIWKSESQKFEQMQQKSKQLCEKRDKLIELGDALLTV